MIAIAPALLVTTLLAQGPVIRYEVQFPNRVHHEAEVTAIWTDLPPGTVELRMSRSSPGRYAVHEFAKNIYAVRADDGAGNALPVEQPNPYQWNVSGHHGTVRVRYTLFGDRADGTYAGIDRTHAHLNVPATFLWARGLDPRPIEVTFPDLPAGWTVATQLEPIRSGAAWRARDFQYFMDSPIEVGPVVWRAWPVRSGAREDTMRLAIHHLGTDQEVDAYVTRIQRVVREEAAVFGEFAPYDHGTYTFLADYLPDAAGDGMEHRNSTILTSTAALAESADRLLGTVAHEFFHSWNVERIRPRGIEPFDFEEANMTGELWLAEGFTNYYAPLMIRRAGLMNDAEYARRLSGAVNALTNAPGRRFFGPRGMSMQAPFVDAATSIDPQNKANTFISYYTYGEALGLALDLTLRSRRTPVTLDDFMREMWVRFGKTERAYSIDDVERTLAAVTRDAAFAAWFRREYLDGRERPDYETLLARAGFSVRTARPGAAWLGDLALREESGGGLRVASSTLIDTPAYDAGIDRDDVLQALDGKTLTTPSDLGEVLRGHHPGDSVTVTWRSRGTTQTGTIVLAQDPRVEVVAVEETGGAMSDAQRGFRAAWLGSKAGN